MQEIIGAEEFVRQALVEKYGEDALAGLNIKIEQWKFNETYGVWVSSEGRIKDENKNDVSLFLDENTGYLLVETKRRPRPVHRVVLETFKPIEDRSMTVDHINRNKRDNSLDNLEWVSKEENMWRAKSIRDWKEPVKEEKAPKVKKIKVKKIRCQFNSGVRKQEEKIPLTKVEFSSAREAAEMLYHCDTKFKYRRGTKEYNIRDMEEKIKRSIFTGRQYRGMIWYCK